MKKKIKFLIYFLLIFTLLVTPFDWRGFLILEKKEVSAATALTNVSNTVTNTQINATTYHQINFTTYTTVPSDGKIVITFPAGFDVSGATFNAWSGFDGGQNVSVNAQEVTVTRDGAGTDSAAGDKYIKFSNIVNTATPGTNYTVTVETQDSSGTTLDGPTTSFYFSICTNSSLTNTYHIPWTSTVSVAGKHTTKFTTASAIPNDGKIKITFPSGFDISSATFNSWSGFDGGQSINIASQTITITRDGTGTDATAGDKYIILDNITNHSTASSSYYVILETTDSTDTNIEGPTSIRFSIFPAISSSNQGLANSAWPAHLHDNQATSRSSYAGPEYPALKWFKDGSSLSGGAMFNFGGIDENGNLIGTGKDMALTPQTYYVHSLNRDTGAVNWSAVRAIQDCDHLTVANNGMIYNVDGDSKIKAYDTTDGSIDWTYTLGSTSDRNNILVDSSDNIYFSNRNVGLTSLNSNGNLRWTYPITSVGSGMKVAFNNAEDTIYIGSGNILYAIDTNGNLVWQNTDVRNVSGGAVVDSDGIIYCMSSNINATGRGVYAINPDGSPKWFYSFGVIESDRLRDASLDFNNTLYFKRDDSASSWRTTLYALNTNDGSVKWTKYLGNTWDSYKSAIIDSNNRIYHLITIADVRTYASFDADGNTRWIIRGTGTAAGVTGGIIDERGWYYVPWIKYDSTTKDGGWAGFAPWTLSASTDKTTYNVSDTITTTATSSMLQSDPRVSEDNKVQAIMPNGDKVPLSYVSTDGTNTTWQGTWVSPSGPSDGNYNTTTKIEASAYNVETDITTTFDSAPTGSNNTGITQTINSSSYTNCNTPTNLHLDLKGNELRVAVNSFPNDTQDSSGYYFTNGTTNSGWIQTNIWTDPTVNLSTICNYSDTWTVKYRNGNSVETSTISLTQGIRGNACSGAAPPEEEEPEPPPGEEDQDNDGIPDTWEEEHNLNPENPSDADQDLDHDGLTNKEEYEYNTNPSNKDSDNDKYTDKVEIQHGTDPNNPEDNPHDICLQYYKNFRVHPLCRMKEIEDILENHYLILDSNLNNNTIPKENFNLNPNNTPDANLNSNHDSFTNKEEYQHNTDSNNKDTGKVEIENNTDLLDLNDDLHSAYLQHYENFKKNSLRIIKEIENTFKKHYFSIKDLISRLLKLLR